MRLFGRRDQRPRLVIEVLSPGVVDERSVCGAAVRLKVRGPPGHESPQYAVMHRDRRRVDAHDEDLELPGQCGESSDVIDHVIREIADVVPIGGP